MIMYYSMLLILSFLCFTICLLLRFSGYGNGKLSKLPPGPSPLPILGNILELTDKPHHTLSDLSKAYGPLMYLKLGSIHTLVVSSADVARELFLKHDLAFSSRRAPNAARVLDHHPRAMIWLPVSPQWRNLRKISSLQLFTAKRLDDSNSLRQRKVNELLEYVEDCFKNGQAVDIGQVGFTTTLNLLSNTFFSVDLASYSSSSSQELKDIIWHIMECIGKPNLADYFPLLSYFDPIGMRRDADTYFSRLFAVLEDVISQRLSADPSISCAKDDVLETLIKISKEDGSGFSTGDIKHLLLDLFVAGTDTTSSTLEWAMTELLCNPSKMVKAQAELNVILGKDGQVQESDIGKLPYLQAVVKETLRLHPPAPLLVPHIARDDVEFCSYFVPKDTQVLVNIWAIGRDPGTWRNPTEFLPERFLEREIDMRGRDFELIPFGSGRRICPGMPLAYRMVHLMLASLLHGFGWKLVDGMSKEDMDMNEKFGLTLKKAKPLLAVPLLK